MIAVTLFLHRKEGTGIQSGLSLVLGGALGNLIDRVLFRHVADFIDIGVRNIRWPVFNIADSAVVIGMVVLFIYLNLAEKKKKKTEVTQEIE